MNILEFLYLVEFLSLLGQGFRLTFVKYSVLCIFVIIVDRFSRGTLIDYVWGQQWETSLRSCSMNFGKRRNVCEFSLAVTKRFQITIFLISTQVWIIWTKF